MVQTAATKTPTSAFVGRNVRGTDAKSSYAVAGLGIFGAFTIYDFNRRRHEDAGSAILIAASIFLDVFNVFLLLLDLFGGSRD